MSFQSFQCPCGHSVYGWGHCGGGCGRHWTQGKALQMGLIQVGVSREYDTPMAPGLGIDVTDGDLVENLGDGLGIDLETGDLEMEVAPGIDIDLGDNDGGFFGGW